MIVCKFCIQGCVRCNLEMCSVSRIVRLSIALSDMCEVLLMTWWRHQMETFSRYWPFVRGIHRSPLNSPHKGQWRGALIVSLIYAWINGWINNHEAGDLRRRRAHHDVTVMGCTVYVHRILGCIVPSNLKYKSHQAPKPKCFSLRLAAVFAQSIEARSRIKM